MMNNDLAIYVCLLVMQAVALYLAQRRIFGLLMGHLPYRRVVYCLLGPGTVLHELAHLIMAIVLRVRVGRVRLFWPQTMPDGSATLGYVEIDATIDPIRRTLVSIAPVLLLPPALFFAMDFAVGIPLDYPALSWQVIVAVIALLLTAGSAFPSPGDRIGISGAAVLIAIVAIGWTQFDLEWVQILKSANIIYLPATLANLFMMGLLSWGRS